MHGALAGRRVLLTGASSGIGAATADRLARHGARMALLARSETGLRRVAARAEAVGAEAHVLPVDVRDRAALGEAVRQAVTLLGGLDLAIVDAGGAAYGPFRDTSPEDFDATMAVTFTGAIDTVRLTLAPLQESAGVLVVVVSVASRLPLPLLSAYSAAKHALRGALGALRVELRAAGSPVQVCMVHPGPVDTPFWWHVSSQHGRLPPFLPVTYSAEAIARVVVGTALRPRRERTVGAMSSLGPPVLALARPVADAAMAAGVRWVMRHGAAATGRGTLYEATGDGEHSGGLYGRPSLLERVRNAGGPPDVAAGKLRPQQPPRRRARGRRRRPARRA
ncbi:MAG: family NAD(P)-dependent oxidoreductase [Solirubrobacterales bacterium]|nr:family NAD(P)-dependent oxidoreductase [Solirubrobacterales bacterium]